MKNVEKNVKKDIIQQIVSVINTALISLQSLIWPGDELSPGELQLNWLPVMFAWWAECCACGVHYWALHWTHQYKCTLAQQQNKTWS